MRLLPLYSDPTTTTTFSTLVHLFVQQPGGVSGRVCRHCQGGPDQEAPRHVGTTHAQEAESRRFQTHAIKDGAHCQSGAQPHAEVISLSQSLHA